LNVHDASRSHAWLPQPSDEELVQRVAVQDVQAFSLLYDRYAQPVYALAAHLLGVSDAEEIVQEVFLQLWRNALQFDASRGSFKSWFMTIARHRALDELKRRSREQRNRAALQVEEVLAQAPDPAEDVVNDVWQREHQHHLLRVLRELPAEQRRAIVLAYFGGYSQSAIAQQLNWPLGTVKKRIRLGLQKLRAALVRRDEVR
jgi:RNA polymerase sigma-70 factor (ECF subfamily)